MNLKQRFIDREVVGEQIKGVTLECKMCSAEVADLDNVENETFYCFVSDRSPACEDHAKEYSESIILVTGCEYNAERMEDWITGEWIEITEAEPGPEFELRDSDITPDLFVKDGIRTCPKCNSKFETGVGIRGPRGSQYFRCPNCSKLLSPIKSEFA